MPEAPSPSQEGPWVSGDVRLNGIRVIEGKMPWSLTEFEKICDTKLAGSKVDTIHFEDVKLNPDTIISSLFKTMLDRVDPE